MAGESDPQALAELPLEPLEFLVMLVLTSAPQHGYGIVQEIAAETGGNLELIPGNLYKVLKHLMDRALIVPVAGDDDDQRRYYQLTDFGRQVAAAEAMRLRSLVISARRRRLIMGP